VKADCPPRPTAAENGLVTVSFDVDQSGIPINFHVRSSTDRDLDNDLIAMLSGWRFRPGMKDGMRVSVPCTLDFVWGARQEQSSGSRPWTLEAAALRGQIDVVASLLREGADPNVIGSQGNTPLHDASLKGNSAVVKLLLEHGAKVDIRSKDGTLPLHDAVLGGNAKAVSALLVGGVDIAAPITETMETALHLAAAWGKLEVLQVLLSANASTTLKDAKGRTPLDEAIANDQQEAAAVIRKYSQ